MKRVVLTILGCVSGVLGLILDLGRPLKQPQHVKMMQTKKMCTGKCWFDKGDFDHLGSGGGSDGSSHQETLRSRMQEKPLVSGGKYTTSRLHIYPTSPQILSVPASMGTL